MQYRNRNGIDGSRKGFGPAGTVLALFLLAMGLVGLAACGNPLAGGVAYGQTGQTASFMETRTLSGPKSGDAAWVAQTSIYQIFPDKFSPERNLAGITSRMDYLKKLGVGTIWLMPIFSAQHSHGYDITDYYSIASNYGSLTDLKALVDAAHAQDIRVVLDLVINHTGTQNAWFASSNASVRKDNWYVWADHDLGWNDPWVLDGSYANSESSQRYDSSTNHPGATWFLDPYADYDRNGNGNAHDDDYYYSVFGDSGGATMPDLNWKGARSQILAETLNIMKYWIDQTGVDGYRCDAARYLVENGPGQQTDQPDTHQIWKDLRSGLSSYAPGAVIIAEAPTEYYSQMKAYYGTSASPEFHSAFHFKFQYQLMNAIKNNSYAGGFWTDLFAIQGGLYSGAADSLFLSNHDSFTGDRVGTQLSGNTAKEKMAASLYMLLSGNPVTYYGEEYGMQNVSGQSGDSAIRGDMNWSTVDSQKTDLSSVLNHYRYLYRLRSTYNALRGGISYVADSTGDGYTTGYSAGGNHMAFVREWYGEKILVVHNFSDHSMTVNVNLSSTGLSIPDGTVVKAIMGGGSYPNVSPGNLASYPAGTLAAYTSRVLFIGDPAVNYGAAYPTYENAGDWSGTGPSPVPSVSPSPSAYPSTWTEAYFRGTPNAWGISAMTKAADGRWETTQTFTDSAPAFKISHYQNWNEAYPSSNYNITQGTGTYNIKFNDVSKAIEATKLVSPSPSPSAVPSPSPVPSVAPSPSPSPASQTVVIHYKEFESSPLYKLHTWNGISGDYDMSYEGYLNNAHWWKITVNQNNNTFSFCFVNQAGHWDGTNRNLTGQTEVYTVPNSSVLYTTRP